ncbi:MAG: phage tail protein [Akkermansiaceae bacterium]|nr:phage tail protein [Akkermansiaceae bacterium]NNM29674.1 phage tail protein [Akkermansiaceae bacterium]
MKHYLIIILAVCFPVLTALVAQDPGGGDHVGNYNFKIEIDGVTQSSFESLEGISAEIEVIEYQDGTDNLLRKRPGRAKFGNITLKKGYVTNTELFDWWKEVAFNPENSPRRVVTVMLMDSMTNNPLQTWELFECFPKSWKVSSLDGKGNDVLTEEIEIAVEFLKMK